MVAVAQHVSFIFQGERPALAGVSGTLEILATKRIRFLLHLQIAGHGEGRVEALVPN